MQDYLDLGQHGYAMSRYSGCWVAFKCVTDVVESGASVVVDPNRVNVKIPTDFVLFQRSAVIEGVAVALTPELSMRDGLTIKEQAAAIKRAGLARHIGVSNFTVALIEEAVKLADEPLVCNQIEVHPLIDRSKVIAACRRHRMAAVAYSPVARGGVSRHKVLTRIGKTHGKSAVQVSLRFLVQRGIAVIPRTSRLERLSENLAIFDFEFSEAEMAEIARLARRDGRIVDYAYSGSPQWD